MARLPAARSAFVPAPAVLVPVLLALAAPALSGCGNRAELKPLAGRTLPTAPYGRDVKPGADDLLTAPVDARPQRSVELRSRSQDREDDPFDLPPEN